MTTSQRSPAGPALAGVVVVVMIIAAALWLDGEPETGLEPAAVVALPAHDPSQDSDPAVDVLERTDDGLSEAPLPEPTSLIAERPGPDGLSPQLTVVDSVGRPVSFAQIVVGARLEVLAVVGAPDLEVAARIRNVTRLRADGAGRCEVHLRRADYAVFAWAPGRGSSAVWGAAALFEEPRDEIELTLQLPALLAGRVMAPDNRPLPGAYVSFERPGGSAVNDGSAGQLQARLPKPMHSDAAGNFRVYVDAPQTLKVSAVHSGSPTNDVLVSLEPDGFHDILLLQVEQ